MYIILYKSHSPCNKFNSVSSSSSENIMTARISPLLFNHCPKGIYILSQFQRLPQLFTHLDSIIPVKRLKKKEEPQISFTICIISPIFCDQTSNTKGFYECNP